MLAALKKSLVIGFVGGLLASICLAGAANAEITIQVAYSNAAVYKAVQERIAAKFMKAHPDIKIEFRIPAASYEALAQQLLLDKITNTLPDVAFNAINQLRLFVEQKLPIPLDSYAHADGGM